MKSARLVACTIAFVACVSAYAGNAGPYAVCDTLLPKIETDSAAVKAGDNVAAGQQAAGTDSLVAGSDSLAADSSKIAQAVDSVMRDAKKHAQNSCPTRSAHYGLRLYFPEPGRYTTGNIGNFPYSMAASWDVPMH